MRSCLTCGNEVPVGEFAYCPHCGAPLVERGGSQRKTVSIMFCDLVDSTVLGSSLDPEVLRSVYDAYWGRAHAVVERHGGTVEKFIGDAVVGVFGMPVLHEDDALRAVRAAADLVVEVRELSQVLQQRFALELAVRVGVNTGEVLAGAGEVALMAGDAANVAARLEQAAGPGEVLLGEATRHLLRDAVEVVDVGPLSVKGKGELPAFRLVTVRPVSASSSRGRQFAGAMVGRLRQLQLAENAYATAVEEAACVLLTVVGEPGVGKSRLVEELLAGIGDVPMILPGRCLPYGQGITYWATTEMLNRLAELDPRPLTDWLSDVEHAEQVLAGLDTMLGRAQTATGGEVAWAFRRLVETLASGRPVVLVVDDLQWADDALLDLLDHLTDLSRGVAILLVAMARPELLQRRPTWGAQRLRSFTTVVAPLSPTECGQLTSGLLGPGVDAVLRERVAHAAGGIPLFVEEMLAMLVDQGQLVADPAGGWRLVSDVAEVTVPASVQALLADRLDRLTPPQRDVLGAASVIGEKFYPQAVASALGDPPDLPELLTALVRADLIAPTGTDFPGQDAYAFAHLLVRDAAYKALPKARRGRLHEAIARWLQAARTDTTTLDVVGFHLEQAATYGRDLGEVHPALAEEAARHLLRAADRSLALGDAATAGRLLDRAGRVADRDSAVHIEIDLALSEALRYAGDHTRSIAAALQAEQTASLLGADVLRWRAALQRCMVEFWSRPTARVEEVFALTADAVEALTEHHDDAGLALAFEIRADAYNMIGREGQASAEARQGLRHAHRAGRGAGRQRLVSRVMDTFEIGAGSIDGEAATIADLDAEFGADPGMDLALDRERIVHQAHLGHLEEALARAWASYHLSLEQGSPVIAAGWLTWGISWCQRWGGDLAGAVQSMTTSERMLGEGGAIGARSTILAIMGPLLALLGRDDEAAAATALSRETSLRNDLLNDIYNAVTDGLLHARRGDAAACERSFDEAAGIAAATDFLVARAEVWLARSYSREWLGDTQGALADAWEALHAFEHKGHRPPITITQARVAELGGERRAGS